MNAKMIGTLVALAGVGLGLGIAYASSKPAASGGGGSPPKPGPTPGPSPTPSPGPSTSTAWIRTTDMVPGDRIRVSVAAADVAQIAQSLGASGSPTAIWQSILSYPAVAGFLHPAGGMMQGWVPGQPLPTDWPADDTAAASEYHAEFTYQGAGNIDTSTSPVPLLVWVGKGTGA